MKELKWIMLANCIMWIACCVAVSIALYLTQRPICLWGLLTPVISGGYGYTIKTDDTKTHKID